MSVSHSHREGVRASLRLSACHLVRESFFVVQAVDVPSHVRVLTSEQAVANVTRNPCKLYPQLPQPSGLSTISRGHGECLCSSGACLCTNTICFRLAYCLMCPRADASIVGFRWTKPARLPAFRRLIHVPADGAIPFGAVPPFSAVRALPAVTTKPSLRGQWQPSTFHGHISRRATRSGNFDRTTSSQFLRRGHR